MKFIVKDMNIATGGILVAVLHADDAKTLDVHNGDRILLRYRGRKTVAILNVALNGKSVKPGRVGLFEEVLSKLKLKHRAKVDIDYAHKPKSLEYIKKKLDGGRLNNNEIDTIVRDIVRDELTEGELTYFVSACYARGMGPEETVALTNAIVNNGKKLKIRRKIMVDKHCIGGIPGNRTTMILVPIVAAAGFTVPKTSSRSITSAAGTADTMEVLAKVILPVHKMDAIAKKCGGFIAWGGGVNMASADDKLIRVRNPLSIDPEGMLLSSILAKKKAVNATHVLIDIPLGKDTKIKSMSEANHLKGEFKKIGRRLGIDTRVMISKGDDIIGNGVGPALEARDVLKVLQQTPDRPLDLEKKSVAMAAKLLEICGVKKPLLKAHELLESGAAWKKMQQIIKAQGGNPKVTPAMIRVGKHTKTFRASKSGKVSYINIKTIARMAKVCGAPIDKGAGLFSYVHIGTKVRKGDPLFTLYSPSKAKLKFASEAFNKGDLKIS